MKHRYFAWFPILFAGLLYLASVAVKADDGAAPFSLIHEHIKNQAYNEAEQLSLLVIEKARQGETYSPGQFLQLGIWLQKAGQYRISQKVLALALEKYTRRGALEEMARTLMHLGISARNLANYEAATDYFNRALTIATMYENSAFEAQLHMQLGIAQKEQGHVETALQTLKKALTLFRDEQSLSDIGVSLATIGDIYVSIEQLSEAKDYYDDAYTMASTAGNRRLAAIVTMKQGALLLRQGHTADAIKSLKDAIHYFEHDNDKFMSTQAGVWLGEAYVKMGNTQQGLGLLQQGLRFAQSSKHYPLINLARLALANAMLAIKNFDQALQFAQEGAETAQQIHNVRSQLDFLTLQVNAYAAKGNFKQALDLQSLVQTIKEQILQTENQAIISRLQAGIEVERQAQSIQMLKQTKAIELAQAEQENLRNTLGWSLLLASLLSAFLVWSRLKQREQNIALQREVKQRTVQLENKNNELQHAYKALEQVSLRDSLTGLYNRHYLESQLPGEVKRSQFALNKQKGHPTPNQDLLCFLIDIDHFKRINDAYGHLAGDKVLVKFAQILREVFRQSDLIIRWGGEEFVVICKQSSRNELPEIAERCRIAISQHSFDVDSDEPIKVTCSIGFSVLPPDHHISFDDNWKQTFSVVDYCLYASKLSGRNGWVGVLSASTKPAQISSDMPLDRKFKFTHSHIATSFNNVASIVWPSEE
ncbi:diguanylate cyclase [Alteromonas sp. 345S023]|uniref:diguanylate cyclase n=1 Tax=Alteromonas profundi TaxID=2696062 RepID=A0A7X5LIY6_9ALTE|nr:diguanylate cyclase [Alteromonas profundi]NDV90203.1 diguanylate cyclase [Alteromonas profundi]